MSGSSLIGSKISLISRALIRYEGVLYQVDQQNSTVSLERVRCLGTEGRKNGVNEIAPTDATYELIVFRVSDIKDLKVLDVAAKAQSSPHIQTFLSDPAIVSVPKPSTLDSNGAGTEQRSSRASAAQNQPIQTRLVGGETSNGTSSYPAVRVIQKAQVGSKGQEGQTMRPARTFDRDDVSRRLQSDGQGSPSTHRPRRHPRYLEGRPHKNSYAPDKEFDIQYSNTRFEKIVDSDPGINIGPAQLGQTSSQYYNKSESFFDAISCSATEREQNKGGDTENPRGKSHEKVRLNVETFGKSGYDRPSYAYGRGRDFRGRGRGSRGSGHNSPRRNHDAQSTSH